MAERTKALARLREFAASDPLLNVLFANEDLVLQFRGGHLLPTVRWSGQASTAIPASERAGAPG